MGRILFFKIARTWMGLCLADGELEKMRVREDRGLQGQGCRKVGSPRMEGERARLCPSWRRDGGGGEREKLPLLPVHSASKI